MKTAIFLLGLLVLSVPAYSQKEISIQEYMQMRSTQQGTLIDVRADWEYVEGHLPGAVQMDIFQPDFKDKVNALDKAQTYYVYCYSGGRSREAVAYMQQQGFRQVYNIRDGIPVMRKQGIALRKGDAP